MKLAKLEFNVRYYIKNTDTSSYTDYSVMLSFDVLKSLSIDENLQVCTCETVRGKNKTFNAFLKPKTISLSGSFCDYQTTNIEILNDVKNSEKQKLETLNSLTGKDKSEFLNRLFTSMVEDTRLITVKTFYKDYENFVMTGFNLVYVDNSTIDIELTLQEMLLVDLDQHLEGGVPYQLTTKLTEEEYLKAQYISSKILGGSTSITAEELESIKES